MIIFQNHLKHKIYQIGQSSWVSNLIKEEKIAQEGIQSNGGGV